MALDPDDPTPRPHVPRPRPLYRVGCCVHCGRKVKTEKYEPVFNIPEGPVYLHPKCEHDYNEGIVHPNWSK